MPSRPRPWLDDLAADLADLEAHHQRRRLTPVTLDGPFLHLAIPGAGEAAGPYLNLASNDYLGLSQHPHLRQAAIAAIQASGTGSGSARLVSGHLDLHARVEARFAAFKHAQAALLCPTGYLANHAVLTTLAGPGDLICLDKLCHASLIDAARASGAEVRIFPHLNYDKLAGLLARAQSKIENPKSKILLVSDSIFSMDGDAADLPRLCDLAAEHGAILIVDEAHATGVLGATGAGLGELQGVADRVDVAISTASKALGGLGGIITAPQLVIDSLINHARSFIYTTSIPPAQAATLDAALDVLHDEPHRRQRLADLSNRLHSELAAYGFFKSEIRHQDAEILHPPAPIIPLIAGTAESALALAAHLRRRGIFAPAIRPPTVAPGSARVRLSLRADLEDAHLDQLVSALRTCNLPRI